MGSLVLSIAGLLALAACGTDFTNSDDIVDAGPPYRDVTELFDRGIAPTCSLNNGVCHNSNSYPDLHTISNLIATVDRPCNMDRTDPLEVHDACEPNADHLVIASAGIDARIISAALPANELDLDVSLLTHVTLTVDPPPIVSAGASDVEVHRGSTTFLVDDYGVKVTSVSGAQIVLDLRSGGGQVSAKRFFDVRVWPPGPLRVHTGDPNGNGIEGALDRTMPLVAPGDPAHSYMMRRLVDGTFGELMPRQCRTWNDRANLALACWITGLVVDTDGHVANAYDPIDYTACTMVVAGLGKCSSAAP